MRRSSSNFGLDIYRFAHLKSGNHMNRKEKKIRRKELIRRRVPSEVERQRQLEAFESGVFKDEFYDLDVLDQSVGKPSGAEG